MTTPIRAKINVSLIDKAELFKGAKGTYLDLYLYPTPDDQYGNDYRVTQDISKASRDAGKRGAILGNAKNAGAKPPAAPPRQQAPPKPADPDLDADSDSIPF